MKSFSRCNALNFALSVVIPIILFAIPQNLTAEPLGVATEVLTGVSGENSAVTGRDTLVIARVSHNPKKHFKHMKPMVDYVVRKLNDPGIRKGKVLLVRDNEALIQLLRKGEIDWVDETVFSALIYSERADAEIFLRRWKKGVPEYHTVFFTKKGSGIKTLKDLKGGKIAFNDPGSTTSFFLPAGLLIQNGVELERLHSIRAQADKTKAGYVFSKGDELNVSGLVYNDFADAGAFSNLDWKSPHDVPNAMREVFTIFFRSQPVPRSLTLFRKDLDPGLKDKIKNILLNAHTDPEGKKVLQTFQKTAKFDPVDENILESLEEARKILRLVEEKIK